MGRALFVFLILINCGGPERDVRAPGKSPGTGDERISQPAPVVRPIDDQYSSFLTSAHVLRAPAKKEIAFPVNWSHSSHPLNIYSGSFRQQHQEDYSDLWLAKALTLAFTELHDTYNVEAILHWSIYSYRNIGNTDKLSRHAMGLAIDIPAFRLKDGTVLSVEDHWRDPALGPKLKAIRDFFCRDFDVILSPDYNADHHDHLHIDLDPNRRSEFEPQSPRWNDLAVSSNIANNVQLMGLTQLTRSWDGFIGSFSSPTIPMEGRVEGIAGLTSRSRSYCR